MMPTRCASDWHAQASSSANRRAPTWWESNASRGASEQDASSPCSMIWGSATSRPVSGTRWGGTKGRRAPRGALLGVRRSLLRLRYRAQIRLQRLEALRILLLGVLIGHRRRNDDVLARLPIHRRGDHMPGGQLAGIEEAQHLVEVAAGAHRIHDHRLDLLVGPDDEHGAHRGVVHGGAFAAGRIGVGHVVELRDGEIGVADQRVVDGGPLRLLDVLDPGLVIAHGIDAESDDLGVPLVELGLETGHVAELSGANGREVLRMREEDCPLVADPFVEVDLPLRGLSGEIRRLVSYAY